MGNWSIKPLRAFCKLGEDKIIEGGRSDNGCCFCFVLALSVFQGHSEQESNSLLLSLHHVGILGLLHFFYIEAKVCYAKLILNRDYLMLLLL